jgi:hypothetical protein
MDVNLTLDADGLVKVIRECHKSGVAKASIGEIELTFGLMLAKNAYEVQTLVEPKTLADIALQTQEINDVPSEDPDEWEHISDPLAWQARMLDPEVTATPVKDYDNEET